MPTGSPTRSTKSVMIRPRSVRLGFSLGTPTSGGRCGNSVTTGDRVTAARPTTTATRLVAPTESPTPSDISLHLDRTLSGIQSCLTAGALLADGSHTGNQWQIQSCHPAWRKFVDGGNGVERAQAGRQAAGGGRVASRAVGEPERRLLEDARCALDVDAIDVVLDARRPFWCGIVADPVDMFELDAGLALVLAVDREPHGRNVARRDDPLGGLALGGCHPLVPRGGDLVEHNARRVGDHRNRCAPGEYQNVGVL